MLIYTFYEYTLSSFPEELKNDSDDCNGITGLFGCFEIVTRAHITILTSQCSDRLKQIIILEASALEKWNVSFQLHYSCTRQ